MKKQIKQVITLVVLCILWAISAHINKIAPTPPSIIKTKAAKVVGGDTQLMNRFHRVRARMDALYHYRIKPAPFDPRTNPFRLAGTLPVHESGSSMKVPLNGPPPPGYAASLLNRAIAEVRIGGVMTMNGTTQLTVDGQLHREGDVFTAKVLSKLVLIKIKNLTIYTVTFALEGSSAGRAEIKVRLK